jgi:hypothetical protein
LDKAAERIVADILAADKAVVDIAAVGMVAVDKIVAHNLVPDIAADTTAVDMNYTVVAV